MLDLRPSLDRSSLSLLRSLGRQFFLILCAFEPDRFELHCGAYFKRRRRPFRHLSQPDRFQRQGRRPVNSSTASALANAPNATGGPVIATAGCTSYSPTDQSGAYLTFSSVSAQYCRYGNIVYVYGNLTYPSTASSSNAAISLSVAVPNQTYAGAAPCLAANDTTTIVVNPTPNTSKPEFYGLSTQTAVQNSSRAIFHPLVSGLISRQRAIPGLAAPDALCGRIPGRTSCHPP